jgi:hypothetical protein
VRIAFEVLLHREPQRGLDERVVQRLVGCVPASVVDVGEFLHFVEQGVFGDEDLSL